MSARLRHGAMPLLGYALGLALLTGCGRKSDDEKWLEKIHSTPVYLYTALKILIIEPERDQDVREARELLRQFEYKADAPPPDAVKSAGQVLALGRALWKLRGLGEAEVTKGRDSQLRILPLLPANPLAGLWTRDTEHGVLLLALLLGKLDSRSPAPVPPEVMLYEAYMTGTEPLPDALLASFALSAQTAVTAEAELCDVAGRFSDQLVKLDIDVQRGSAHSLFASLLTEVGTPSAGDPNVTEAVVLRTLMDVLPLAIRLLAHGRAALCFDGRDQPDRSRVEWERAVALAGKAGIPEADLALVQAFAAYRAKDWPATREHLQRASKSTLLTADEQVKVQLMADRFDESDPGLFESLFDRAFVLRTVVGMVNKRLRDAGLYDQLAALPEVVAARSALQSVSGPGLEVQSAELEAKGAGLWQRVKAWWGG